MNDLLVTTTTESAASWSYEEDQTRWLRADVLVTNPADLDPGGDRFGDLYRKATHGQWDINTAIDWTYELNEENPLSVPDATNPLAGTAVWDRMTPRERIEVRRHLQGWQISQILHGERASMMCAGKLMLSASDPMLKACAALQATDEARHVEVYSRLSQKIGVRYDVSPKLDRLLIDTLSDSDPDITVLGMQILIEGLALAFFKSLQGYSNDAVLKGLLSLVVRDEARHFAGGTLCLADRHLQLSESELARREEFVTQACMLLHEYLYADEIWEPLGLPKAECAELARNSPVNDVMHRILFRNLVPAVRSIGLLGPKARRAFEQIGVLDYAAFPI